MHAPFRRSGALLAILLLTAACAAGCASSDADSPDDARSTEPAQPSPVDETDGDVLADRVLVNDAKQRIKQLVTAIETCAVSNSDGSYTGCSDADALRAMDPALAELAIGSKTPDVDAFQIELTENEHGYVVQTAIKPVAGSATWFAERHDTDGRVEKLCGGEPVTLETDEDGAFVDAGTLTDACPDGEW